jgi:hypothetical protein
VSRAGPVWRLAKIPHEQRVALRESMLRGAARAYVGRVNTLDEESAATELREAAVDYAMSLLQRAVSVEPAARRPRARRTPPRTESP